MNLIREAVLEYDELPIQEIGSELKPGMTKVFFPAETKRFVHVSRGAIIQNTKNGRNHPTILVIDEAGNKHAFHAVVLRGPSALKFSQHEPGIDANAFLVTRAGIEAYTDPYGDEPIKEVPLNGELPAPVRERFSLGRSLVRTGRRAKLGVWRFLYGVPVASCLVAMTVGEPPEKN
jgi:hypothetical protein